MKVCFIGLGKSGAAAAFTLQISGLAREIALVDADVNLASREAARLMHGSSLTACRKIYGGGKEMIDGADIVIITNDVLQRVNPKLADTVNAGTVVFREVIDDIRKSRLPQNAILIVAANPVDIMTQIAVDARILPPDQVIGTGTLLDTVRFRSLIAEYFSVDPMSVSALILGEHGGCIVPVWSSVSINGVPIESFPSYNEKKLKDMFKSAAKTWHGMITLKNDDGWAFGLAICELVAAVAMDKRKVMPISTLQNGAFGIKGICLSLPTVVGRSGVQGVIEIKLRQNERKLLRKSEEMLRTKLAQLN
jgi:L-lactate dehydrogenase